MTPEELNELKAIAASCDTKKRLNELIAQHTPVRKVRDGFREPRAGERRFLLQGANLVDAYFGDYASDYAKVGNCFEHRHNAEMVAKQNLLMASFIRWIDEHGAEARRSDVFFAPFLGRGSKAVLAFPLDIDIITPIRIGRPDLCNQFIRENEADLKKYFENEETLRRTLYE